MSAQPPRPCPICAGKERTVYYRQQFSEGPLGDGYDVVICEECGAAFADDIPSQAELDAYYRQFSKYTYSDSEGRESIYDLRRFETIIDQIVPELGQDAEILDIGCATGGLLAGLKRRGYHRLLGADPSPACAQATTRLYGIECLTASIVELKDISRRFDLIILVGVLEHIRDVADALSIVAGLLKPGGKIYCGQPDIEQFAQCINAPFQQFSIEHLNFFSAPSLRNLLARAGGREVKHWQWMVEWRADMLDSMVSGLFTVDGSDVPVEFDRLSRPALVEYIARCTEDSRQLVPVIEEIVARAEPIFVWGVGTHTRRLLKTTRLNQANIIAFVDSDERWENGRLADWPIVAPAQCLGRDEPVLVSSKAFQSEIVDKIRENNPGRRIVTFY